MPGRRRRDVWRTELAVQPCAREGPFVLDGRRRQVERLRRLLDTETGEVSERDDLRLARIHLFELRQRLVHGDEVVERRIRPEHGLVELDVLSAGAVLDALIMTRALDENAAHREGGRRKEMAPPVPLLRRPIARDTQVCLVNERSGLQSLITLALASEAGFRELPQFVIHFREQLPGSASRSIRVWGADHAKAASL